MSNPDNTKLVIFPITTLYIQLDTNTGENGNGSLQLFKRSMIKMPKMNVPPLLNSDYPFFTKNVRYPSSIEDADWKTKYEFFFNRENFTNRLRDEIDDNPDCYRERLTSSDPNKSKELYKWMQKTEKHNIMVTLRAIFPIPEVFGNALKNSHDHILNNGNNKRVLWDVNIRSAMNIFGFMYKFGIANKEKEEYFINIGGKRYEVDDVVWENDLVNHPIYNAFLKSQRSTYEEVEKSTPEVQEKYDKYMKKLNDDLIDMDTKEDFQRDFFDFCSDCSGATCNDDESRFAFFKEVKNLKEDEIKKKYIDGNGNKYSPEFQYLTHKHIFTDYYNDWDVTEKDDEEQTNYEGLTDAYEAIEGLGVEKNNLSTHSEAINRHFNDELHTIYLLEKEYPLEEEFEKSIIKQYISDLKSDTIFTLRMHMLSKNSNQNQNPQNPYQNQNNDRKTTATNIIEKLKRLSTERGDAAVETIISIKEDFDNHRQLHSGEGISIFMERDYEAIFDRLLKSAIETKAASIVLNFAKYNIPMSLTGKKLDGTDVSPVNQSIIRYIRDFFGTEAEINNQLSTNVNNVFEPVRKTSNRELYNVLKLFKFGDAVMRKEHKSSEINKYREVLTKVHDQYISNRHKKEDEMDEYLYTGVDEVKSTSGSGEEKTNEHEIRRNVQEIYVRMDLVDADMREKSSKPGCKLLDKELEQEYLYLADPRNINNSMLSRFRNLDFESILPNPLIAAAESSKPKDVKDATNPLIKGGKKRIKYTIRNRSDNHSNNRTTRRFRPAM